MKCGSLFSGIGGIELGLINSGLVSEITWQNDNDPYCCDILRKNFPNSQIIEEDITNLDPKSVDQVDILTAGFPCQPVSVAGRQKGTKDERWLFDEVFDFISYLRPRIFLLENVPGLVTAEEGRPFESILEQIASLRLYDFEWQIISARSVGASHLRDRWFGVGISNSNDQRLSSIGGRSQNNEKTSGDGQHYRNGGREYVRREPKTSENGEVVKKGSTRVINEKFTTKQWMGSTFNGLPGWMARLGMKNAWTENTNAWSTPNTLDHMDPRTGDALEKAHFRGDPLKKSRREKTGNLRENANLWSTPRARDWKDTYRPSSERSDLPIQIFNKDKKEDGDFDAWEEGMPRVSEDYPNRVNKLKALGNAVVPQQAELVGRMIIYALKNNCRVYDERVLSE